MKNIGCQTIMMLMDTKEKKNQVMQQPQKGLSAASVTKLLKGIDFPANKDDIITQVINKQRKGRR